MTGISTWLDKTRLDKAGITLKELATAVYKSEKTVVRWGQSKVDKSTIRFDRIAKALKIEESILYKDYQRVYLENNGKSAPALAEEINSINCAIEACQKESLLLGPNSQPYATQTLCDQIVETLDQAKFKPIAQQYLGRNLTAAIKEASTTQLESLYTLISTVASAAVVQVGEKDLAAVGQQIIWGDTPRLLIRLVLDASIGLPFCKNIQFKDGKLKPESIPHIQHTDKATTDNADDALTLLIGDIANRFNPLLAKPPSLRTDPEDFARYCRDLNADIMLENYTDEHIFLHSKESALEDLLPNLLDYLGELRIITTETTDTKISYSGDYPLFRAENTFLAAWLRKHLLEIQQRKETLSGQVKVLAEVTSSEISNDLIQHSNTNQGVVHEVHYHNHIDNKLQQNNTQQVTIVHQQLEQNLQDLKQALLTEKSNPEYQEIRLMVQDALDEIQQGQAISPQTKRWLTQAIGKLHSAAGSTDMLWGLMQKVLELIT